VLILFFSNIDSTYHDPSQDNTAIVINITQPGCFPFVPNSTKVAPANIVMTIELATNEGIKNCSEDEIESQQSNAPIAHPNTVTRCQLAQRILTWLSLSKEPPFVGIIPPSRMRLNIRTSPNIECIRPNKKAKSPATNNMLISSR